VGDSIAFDSTTPHRYWNETDEEVRAVWFIADTSANSPAAGPESSTGHF